jgi:1-acyl-sn-glycerol-3-phosphate acyltransferase
MSYGLRQIEMTPVYGFCHYMICLGYDMLFRGDIYGQDNIPKNGPYLVACNHASHLDPPFAGMPLPHQVRFFARKTLWTSRLTSWWLDAAQVIPVDRDGGSDVGAIKRVLQAIKENKIIMMFPEGTRTPDGNLQPPKSGVGMFACRTGAPVLPARIFGSFAAFGRGGKLRPCTPISIVYGPVLTPADYDDPSRGKERYQHASDIIMSRIARLGLPDPPVI